MVNKKWRDLNDQSPRGHLPISQQEEIHWGKLFNGQIDPLVVGHPLQLIPPSKIVVHRVSGRTVEREGQSEEAELESSKDYIVLTKSQRVGMEGKDQLDLQIGMENSV